MLILVLLSVAAGIVLTYFVLLAAVAWVSVRPPRMPQSSTPAQMGMPQETVSIKTNDGQTLRAWWVTGSGDTTVVFVHGYFTNRCEFVPFVSQFRARGASCLFFDLRAHGTSTGKRCTFGVEEALDVAAAVRWVKEQRPDDRIVLIGNSMGGVACARQAAIEPGSVDGLVLDSAYAKVNEAARGWWSFFLRGKFKTLLRPTGIFGRIFVRVNLEDANLEESLVKISGAPVLFIYGRIDPLIPAASAARCIEAAGPKAEAVWFEDTNHARARFKEPKRYVEEIFGFMERNDLMPRA